MKRRGMLVVAAALLVLVFATVAHADVKPAGCQTDPVTNIVWCSY